MTDREEAFARTGHAERAPGDVGHEQFELGHEEIEPSAHFPQLVAAGLVDTTRQIALALGDIAKHVDGSSQRPDDRVGGAIGDQQTEGNRHNRANRVDRRTDEYGLRDRGRRLSLGRLDRRMHLVEKGRCRVVPRRRVLLRVEDLEIPDGRIAAVDA